MAAVTKTRTYSTGDSLTPAYYNADRDEIIAGVNSIVNAQVADNAAIGYSKLNLTGNIVNADISASAAIAESKLAFGGTSGQYATSDGSGGLSWVNLDTTYNRGFTFGITGTLATGNAQGMRYLIPQNMTVVKVWYKTTSGSAGIRIKKDATTVATATATSTVGSTTSIDSATLTAGQVLTLDITSVSSATDVFVTVECTQS